jgi:PAS domain S-box-containing protein
MTRATDAEAATDPPLRLSATPQGPDFHQTLLDGLGDGVSLSSEDGVIVYANPAEERMFGYAPGEMVGRHVSSLNAYPAEQNERIVTDVIAALKAEGLWEGEWRNRRKDGSVFTTASRITAVTLDGVQHWLCIQRETDGVDTSGSRHAFLLALADMLRQDDPEQALSTVAEMMGEYFRCSRVGYGSLDADGAVFDYRICWTDGQATPLLGRYPARAFGVKIIAKLNRGETVVVEDLFNDPLSDEAETHQTARDVDTRSILVAPFLWGGRLRSILYLNDRSPRGWLDEDVAMIEAMASRTGQMIEAVETERVRRANEARLAFLDAHAQAIASLADADSIMAVTTRLLGEHLQISVCSYGDMDDDEEGFTIRGGWAAPGRKGVGGRHRLSDFGSRTTDRLRGGQTLVINDNSMELPPEAAATYRSIGIMATLCMPLVKDGRLKALMAIHDEAPRSWSEADATLLKDVTERSWPHIERAAAQAELHTSNERFRTAVHAVEGVLWTNDASGRMTGEQPGWSALTGQSQAEYQGYGWANAVHPDDIEMSIQTWNAAVESGRPYVFEHRVRRHDGVWRTFSIRAVPTLAPDGSVTEWVGVHTDVTEQRSAEAALRDLNTTLERRVAEALAERKILADIVEGTDAIVQVIDHQFRWLAVNRAAIDSYQRLVGITPSPGANMLEALAARPRVRELAQDAWALALTGEEFTVLREFQFGDGGRVYLEMKFNSLRDAEGRLIGAFQFATDVSERVLEQERRAQAEEQLRQAQKMEAMGQLTGGVAHDFNNLLTPIIGSLDMLQRKGLGGEREQRLIGGALQSAERARTLVQRLLAFARRQPLQPTAVDVGSLIRGMAELVASTTGPQIRVTVDIAADLPPARADQNQLEMALLNLSVNARDAMPTGGDLRISASAEAVAAGARSDLSAGDYVRLSVADTGVGMDEAVMSRAIEPFFSTKGVGQGTGLGLSMVHGLVQQLGGALRLQSRKGLGCNVELWLPRADALGDAAEEIEARPGPDPVRGVALLVDDEDLVRISTADMLLELGYQVVEASSAEQAVRMIEDGLAPGVVVTDHLMPGMTGTELARVVQAQRPGLPVLIISGYADLEGVDPSLPRLQKPFRSAELAEVLSALTGPV